MHPAALVRARVKILVLSFYFRPDLCAGSFRATPLVDALRRAVPPGSQIDVITTLPNRYQSFSAQAPQFEEGPGLSIFRVALPAHKSGMIDQSRAFVAFSRETMRRVSGRDYDLVFATSSRLMTAVLGAWVARRKRARLYLDIRDIFVDTIKDVLPRRMSWFFRRVFSVLEKQAVRQADKVNLVSSGFAEYFSSRYSAQHFSYFTNGVDDDFCAPAPVAPPVHASVGPVSVGGRPLTVLYAGNLGEGQGLHTILPQLAKSLGARVRFRIIGDGGRKNALREALTALHVTNVELIPPMSRSDLIAEYRIADVLFLHLNNHEAFKKVLPSKLFEYAALGKPVWAGASGYAAQFITSEISNAAVFEPCDVSSAVRALDALIIHDTPRSAFIAKYARANISRQLAEDIVAVAGSGR